MMRRNARADKRRSTDTMMKRHRPVFYVSDGTGITAETIGHSLLTQFDGAEFVTRRIAFVDSEDKARAAAEQINQAALAAGVRAIVISTVVDPRINAVLASSRALLIDAFTPFIAQLEQEFGTPGKHRVGHAHGLVNQDAYEARIDATNYALSHDDGANTRYDDAELILVGVSRSGKTPTCLYLALHFGVRAANYPLTEEDLEKLELPQSLRPFRSKLFGLTIDPQRLQQIRQVRRPGSRYAQIEQCRREVAAAEALFRAEHMPALSTTNASIEEIASKILGTLGIERRML